MAEAAKRDAEGGDWGRGKQQKLEKRPACASCSGKDVTVLTASEVQQAMTTRALWTASDDCKRIRRSFVARNFVKAMDFINAVAVVAEAKSHHPDLMVTSFRTVTVEIYTHTLDGLTDFDLQLADAIDVVPVDYSPKWLKEHGVALGLTAPAQAAQAAAAPAIGPPAAPAPRVSEVRFVFQEVLQTDFTAGQGNALQACVASIFGFRDLGQVPNFITLPGGYAQGIADFVAKLPHGGFTFRKVALPEPDSPDAGRPSQEDQGKSNTLLVLSTADSFWPFLTRVFFFLSNYPARPVWLVVQGSSASFVECRREGTMVMW